MCPMCIATVAWMAAGTTSTGGGLSAVIEKRLRGKNLARATGNHEQGGEDGRKQQSRDDDEDTADRVA